MYLEIILILIHLTPTVVGSLKIRKRLILKKLLPLPAPFQHFRFRVRFRFQPLASKRFRKKINRFHCFRFHIPAWRRPFFRSLLLYGRKIASKILQCQGQAHRKSGIDRIPSGLCKKMFVLSLIGSVTF